MILSRHRTIRSRTGFTLVELMVAAALSITIMWILAESFKMGIDFARSARSTGDMMTQLNNAGQIITADLQQQHFYVSHPGINNNNGKLSSQRLDLLGSSPSSTLASALGYTPPNGYFQVYSPPPTALSYPDNTEGFQLNTVTGTTLQFTVYAPQALPQNQFVAVSNGQTYYSQAAEVAYFLAAPPAGSGPTVTAQAIESSTQLTLNPIQNTSPQPLYNLYRRQRLVAATSDYVPGLAGALNDSSPSDILSYTTLPTLPTPTNQINTLSSFGKAYTVTAGASTTMVPAGRIISNPSSAQTPLGGGRAGDDLLLSNVLSFEVLPCWSPNPNLIPQANVSPRPFTVQTNTGNTTYAVSNSPYNSNYPFDNLPSVGINPTFAANTFDTWYSMNAAYPGPNPMSNPNLNWNWNNFSLPTIPGALPNQNLIPMPIRVTALQITIRVYDPKTKQARQNTWRIAM